MASLRRYQLQLLDWNLQRQTSRRPNRTSVLHCILDSQLHRLRCVILLDVLRMVSTLSIDVVSGDGKTYFNDQDCAYIPRNVHIYNILFGASYLLVDCVSQLQVI